MLELLILLQLLFYEGRCLPLCSDPSILCYLPVSLPMQCQIIVQRIRQPILFMALVCYQEVGVVGVNDVYWEVIQVPFLDCFCQLFSHDPLLNKLLFVHLPLVVDHVLLLFFGQLLEHDPIKV